MSLRPALWGLCAGALLALALVTTDFLLARGGWFGSRSGLIGTTAGGIMLLLAFGMAVASYQMARRNAQPILRRRLLAGALFTGAAGMVCGLITAAVWAYQGPILPR